MLHPILPGAQLEKHIVTIRATIRVTVRVTVRVTITHVRDLGGGGDALHVLRARDHRDGRVGAREVVVAHVHARDGEVRAPWAVREAPAVQRAGGPPQVAFGTLHGVQSRLECLVRGEVCVSRRRRFRDRLCVFARRELVLGVLERRRGHERGKGLDPPRALAVRVALLEQPRGHERGPREVRCVRLVVIFREHQSPRDVEDDLVRYEVAERDEAPAVPGRPEGDARFDAGVVRDLGEPRQERGGLIDLGVHIIGWDARHDTPSD